MRTLRIWVVMSWIALPGVMVGGSLLLQRVSLGDISSFQLTWLRAFHAHGGVLFLMSLLYYAYLDQTDLSPTTKHAGCFACFGGIGAIAGGFLLHAIVGQPGQPSIGTFSTVAGAVLLSLAIAVLIRGLIRAPRRAASVIGS